MLQLDLIITEFVKENIITMYLFYSVLKGIAIATPSNVDNSIVKVIGDMFNAVRFKKIPEDK